MLVVAFLFVAATACGSAQDGVTQRIQPVESAPLAQSTAPGRPATVSTSDQSATGGPSPQTGPRPQQILVDSPAVQTFEPGLRVPLHARASSGRPLNYRTIDVDGGLIACHEVRDGAAVIVSHGTCLVEISQDGDADYAATSTRVRFTVIGSPAR